MVEAKISRPEPKLASWAQHVVHLRAAKTFIEACEAEGIPVLPVKGIVAAYTLYDDPAERALSDVDVRIRPRDYDRLGALARRRGWPFIETKRAYYNYVLEVEGVHVDVECHVGPPHVCSLRVEDMIARATRSRLLGFDALIPDFTDHVVLQVVNAFKDKLVLVRDAAIDDLGRVTEHAAFDTVAVSQCLCDSNVATLGWVVADYAARELGFRRWTELRDALPTTRRRLFVRAMKRARSRPEGLGAIVLARVASDNPTEAMRALGSMARWWITSRLAD